MCVHYSNINLVFLPSCQTSILQPMDQGIIRSFKAIYRSLLLQLKLKGEHQSSSTSFRLPTYIQLICRAWCRVSSKTIINCFHKAGWTPLLPSEESRLLISKEKHDGESLSQETTNQTEIQASYAETTALAAIRDGLKSVSPGADPVSPP